MKIAVIFDTYKGGGGGYFQSLCTSKLLNSIKNKDNEIKFISLIEGSDTELKKYKIETLKFKEQKKSKLFYLLEKSPLISTILNKFGLENPFLKFLKKNNFDLVFFLGPSLYINYLKDINFIVNLYDLNFKFNNFFPEYKNEKVFNQTKELVNKSVDKSFKILVDSSRTKKELSSLFNCSEEKILVYPFSSHIPELNEATKNKINTNLNLSSFKIDSNQRYFFYPAQFWAHKNHTYIIDAIDILKNKKKLDFKIVFSGVDKGNLRYIKKIIKDKNLEEHFIIFNYLTDEEILTLYKKSLGLVMPTYVARSTLPLYEAFYLKIPVFYSKNILDEKLEELVFSFDLNKPEELSDYLLNYDNLELNNKIQLASNYFEKNCNNDLKKKILNNLIEEYKEFSRRWT